MQMPIAVMVDLDYVRRADPAMRRSGYRRRVSQPVGDRRLAAGRARARRGGRRPRGDVRPHGGAGRPAPRGRDRRRRRSWSRWPRRSCCPAWRWPPRARAGRAAAATTRSSTRSTTCSPAPHSTASWPARRACSPAFLRGDRRAGAAIDACLRRHGLPRTPRDLGLTTRPVRRGGACTRRARGRTATRSSSTCARRGRRVRRACSTQFLRGRTIAELRAVDAAGVDLRRATAASTGPAGSTSAASRRT